ncbi:MAG TPA: cytochrome c biogenesis protein CcsA, partial [Candidatus Krumholzibacteria bacterium]|nr:cytochrome c biogenesis protein CcsA [Candidatus Krumholzibacteria bacterium]
MQTRRNAVLESALFMWMAVSLVMVFYYAPIEKAQGIVQKIFYFHVPLAWNAFVGFLIVFIASFRYLATRDPKWDARAVAAAEVGVLFTTLVLITGPIWAKPVWGIWWTWDAILMGVSTVGAAAGIWFAYFVWVKRRSIAENAARELAPIHLLLLHKYY